MSADLFDEVDPHAAALYPRSSPNNPDRAPSLAETHAGAIAIRDAIDDRTIQSEASRTKATQLRVDIARLQFDLELAEAAATAHETALAYLRADLLRMTGDGDWRPPTATE